MHTHTESAAHVIQMLGERVAARAVIADIETEATALEVDGDTRRWWDLARMFDDTRHPAELIEMHHESITYAIGAGLIEQYPHRPMWARVLWVDTPL